MKKEASIYIRIGHSIFIWNSLPCAEAPFGSLKSWLFYFNPVFRVSLKNCEWWFIFYRKTHSTKSHVGNKSIVWIHVAWRVSWWVCARISVFRNFSLFQTHFGHLSLEVFQFKRTITEKVATRMVHVWFDGRWKSIASVIFEMFLLSILVPNVQVR